MRDRIKSGIFGALLSVIFLLMDLALITYYALAVYNRSTLDDQLVYVGVAVMFFLFLAAYFLISSVAPSKVSFRLGATLTMLIAGAGVLAAVYLTTQHYPDELCGSMWRVFWTQSVLFKLPAPLLDILIRGLLSDSEPLCDEDRVKSIKSVLCGAVIGSAPTVIMQLARMIPCDRLAQRYYYKLIVPFLMLLLVSLAVLSVIAYTLFRMKVWESDGFKLGLTASALVAFILSVYELSAVPELSELDKTVFQYILFLTCVSVALPFIERLVTAPDVKVLLGRRLNVGKGVKKAVLAALLFGVSEVTLMLLCIFMEREGGLFLLCGVTPILYFAIGALTGGRLVYILTSAGFAAVIYCIGYALGLSYAVPDIMKSLGSQHYWGLDIFIIECVIVTLIGCLALDMIRAVCSVIPSYTRKAVKRKEKAVLRGLVTALGGIWLGLTVGFFWANALVNFFSKETGFVTVFAVGTASLFFFYYRLIGRGLKNKRAYKVSALIPFAAVSAATPIIFYGLRENRISLIDKGHNYNFMIHFVVFWMCYALTALALMLLSVALKGEPLLEENGSRLRSVINSLLLAFKGMSALTAVTLILLFLASETDLTAVALVIAAVLALAVYYSVRRQAGSRALYVLFSALFFEAYAFILLLSVEMFASGWDAFAFAIILLWVMIGAACFFLLDLIFVLLRWLYRYIRTRKECKEIVNSFKEA